MRCPVELCPDSIAVLRPKGDLSGSRARALGERLTELVRSGTRRFVLDFSGCESADAFGVAVLVELASRRATSFSGLGRALAADLGRGGLPPSGDRFHRDVARALAWLRADGRHGRTWVELAPTPSWDVPGLRVA
ncbi:MAG: STAS domain-containing protein [Planctomycetes bacterium]|nr:STAS domain-containing protein [Planctomycetota bacterium]